MKKIEKHWQKNEKILNLGMLQKEIREMLMEYRTSKAEIEKKKW